MLVGEDSRVKAARLVITRARAYSVRDGRYLTVKVFTTEEHDAEILADVYGGNYYPHRSGWLWILGNQDDIADMYKALREQIENHALCAKRLAVVTAWIPKYMPLAGPNTARRAEREEAVI